MTFTEVYPKGTRPHTGKSGVFTLDGGVHLSGKQRNMLDLASRVAESAVTIQKHGAVVVRGGRVLSVGISKWRNHEAPPIESYNHDLTIHAEVDALSRIADARGAVIYIARVNNQGMPGLSRPCNDCETILNEAGVKRVVYTVP